MLGLWLGYCLYVVKITVTFKDMDKNLINREMKSIKRWSCWFVLKLSHLWKTRMWVRSLNCSRVWRSSVRTQSSSTESMLMGDWDNFITISVNRFWKKSLLQEKWCWMSRPLFSSDWVESSSIFSSMAWKKNNNIFSHYQCLTLNDIVYYISILFNNGNDDLVYIFAKNIFMY